MSTDRQLLEQALAALTDVTAILDALLGVAGGAYPADADGPAVQARAAIAALRARLDQPMLEALTVHELLRMYDENGGDWCRIARAVERRYRAALASQGAAPRMPCRPVDLIDDFYNGTAEQDWPSWGEEAVNVLERIPAASQGTAPLEQPQPDVHPASGEHSGSYGAWQGGMTGDELKAAWAQKLPRREPQGQELSTFALGVEVGIARAVQWLRAMAAEKWSAKEKHPRHWEAYPAWEIVARQVDWLAADLERTLGAPSRKDAEQERDACDAQRYRWLRDESRADIRTLLGVSDFQRLDTFIDAARAAAPTRKSAAGDQKQDVQDLTASERAQLEALLEKAREALDRIAKVRRGLEQGASDDERAVYWASLAMSYRSIASRARAVINAALGKEKPQ